MMDDDYEVIVPLEIPMQPELIVANLLAAQGLTNPSDSLPLLASSVAGLDLLMCDMLAPLENDYVKIQTLPTNCGNDHELISTIQPTAWIMRNSGAYYDPREHRIMRNCVGHWDGNAENLTQHLWHTITNPCFMAYHVVVIIAIFAGIMIRVTASEFSPMHVYYSRTLSCVMMITISLGYDLLAVLFVVISEVKFPDSGNPRKATRAQFRLHSKVHALLSDIASYIPNETKNIICCNRHLSTSHLVGEFLITHLYEPGVSAITAAVKSGGLIDPHRNYQNLTWHLVYSLLTLYRYIREINDSIEYYHVSDFKLPAEIHKLFIKKVIVGAITKGQMEVMQQCMRLLSNAYQPADERARRVQDNIANLSLTHYIGSTAVDWVLNECSRMHEVKDSPDDWMSRKRNITSIQDRMRSSISFSELGPEILQSLSLLHSPVIN